jgi:hypothetical protein
MFTNYLKFDNNIRVKYTTYRERILMLEDKNVNNEAEKTLKKVKIHNIIYITGIFTVIILNILSWRSVDFSDWYVENIFPIWLATYARFTSLFSFSIGEIMLALAVIITLALIIMLLFNIISKRKYTNALKRFATFYAWLFLVVCYVMTLNCFILYHCSGFSDKYMVRNLEPEKLVASTSDDTAAIINLVENESEKTYTKKELATLRDYIVEKCNTLATQIERDEEGVAYYDGDILEAAKQAIAKMGEDYEQLSGFYVTPKYLKSSGFFSQQNIMGYYFPFSMEANINSMMYITNVAPTVCHELAHTKGFIYEEDANMIGFLACINSDDEFLQYCGYLSVLNYVNNEFYSSIDKDSTVYKKHVRISDQVADDNIFLTRETWQVVEKKAVVKTATVKKVSTTLMDTSLKLNGVEEGVLAYDGVVGLLLQYYDGELY